MVLSNWSFIFFDGISNNTNDLIQLNLSNVARNWLRV